MVCLAKRGMGMWGPRTVGNKKGTRSQREREKGGRGGGMEGGGGAVLRVGQTSSSSRY
jgi:hypothetical protein